MSYLLKVSSDKFFGFFELLSRQANARGHSNFWGEPEFCFAVRMCNVHMYSRLFARKEKEAETALAKDGG
jgi:hypothetical protein